MSAAFYPPDRPLTVGEVLDLAFRIFKVTLVRGLPYGIWAMLAGQLANIYELVRGVAAGPHESFGGGRLIWLALYLAGILLTLVAWSGLLIRQRAIIEDRPTGFKSELGATLRRLPAFVVATLLVLAAVGAGLMVVRIIPRAYYYWTLVPAVLLSAYLAILLSCTWPAVLFAGSGPFGALRLSVKLVYGSWWRLCTVYGVGAAVVLVLALLIGALIAIVMPALVTDVSVGTSVFAVVANTLRALLAPFAGALLLATFGELRVRREGIDLQQRIAGLAVE
ncbi:MAG TPA: hypothetical protein VHB68_14030 [Steroidobacteraceae bacterium]|nr:hypothetical protein [Steroidobacteraceae bacterium]